MRRTLTLLLILTGLALLLAPVALADDAVNGETLTDLEAWSSLSGAILPFVAAILLQTGWSSTVKSILVFLLALADATVVTGLTHGWHFDQHWLVSAALVYALARTTYAGLWTKIGTGVAGSGDSILHRVEKKTSVA